MTRILLLLLLLLPGCVADAPEVPLPDDEEPTYTDPGPGVTLGGGPAPTFEGDDSAEKPAVAEPTLVLTFDDHFMTQWYAHTPLIEKYGGVATFFVTRWDMISRYAVADLHDLEDRGHEIAHHGLMHRNPTDYLADHTIAEYIEDEIVPATALMDRDGFAPTAFAYPWGGQTAALDAALQDHFTVLRGSGRLNNPEPLMHPWDGRRVVRGGRVDTGYWSEQQLIAAMDLAVAQNAALVVYAHRIFDEGAGSHITPAELEQVLQLATERGMAFATISELAIPR